jgi:hypothetical protein
LGNSERQLYTNENHKFVNCNPAKKERVKYTLHESRLKGKKFQYGYFEAKAKLPLGMAYSFLDVRVKY